MNRREFLRIGGMSMMALVLGGCGLSSLTGESSGGQTGSSAAAGTAASSSSGTAAAAGGKTLVVYYSATGRTERVAEVIARERQADIMKLVPWPVDAFVKANDFTGKTVVTFATAASSPLGNSGKLLAEMAGGKGSWQDGTCFTGSLSDAKVTDWLKSLKLSN